MENLSHEEVIQQGEQALKEVDFDKAETLFTYGLKQNEYSADAHLGFAKLYLMQGKLESAHFWAQKAKDLASDKANPLAIVAACHMSAGRFGQAIEMLQKALPDAPDNPLVLGNLGKALVMAGKAEEAKPILSKALEVTDAPDVVHYDLALAFVENPQELAELEQAVDHLTASIEANPTFPAPYFLLAKISVRLGLLDQTIELFEDGLGYNPDLVPMREELYALYVAQEHSEKAMVQALELVERRGLPLDYVRVGNTALLTKDFKGAIIAYKQAHDMDPKDPAPVLNLAHVYRTQKKRGQAIKYYRLAAEMLPQSHKPFLGMALVSMEIDEDLEEAQTLLLSAYKIQPKDFDVCIYLAICADRLNKAGECKKYAELALHLAQSPQAQERAKALLGEKAEG